MIQAQNQRDFGAGMLVRKGVFLFKAGKGDFPSGLSPFPTFQREETGKIPGWEIKYWKITDFISILYQFYINLDPFIPGKCGISLFSQGTTGGKGPRSGQAG